ncbi:MAG: hypothetical protein JXM73_16090 [Anaerolineae bacterium]|nr:hypothetical protein [Anaerolineae bacterium]
MSKIFVRCRPRTGRGARRPRFAIVAVEGLDLELFRTRFRRMELEKLAAEIGAEIVYLPHGDQAGKPDDQADPGRQRSRRKQAKE